MKLTGPRKPASPRPSFGSFRRVSQTDSVSPNYTYFRLHFIKFRIKKIIPGTE